MNLVLDIQEANLQCDSILPAANKSSHSTCPICQAVVTGIYIEPLCFNDVERAISLKKNELPSSGPNRYLSQKQQSRKHGRDDDLEIQAESPYLLLSNSNSSISCSGLARGQQRTGRWTNEESALVEFLVTTFDQGLLPLPHGIKLNEFLGDMLLCKSSRLTKKMKNAKLSTRSFVLGKPCAQFTAEDRERLSMLQESFLSSLSSEPIRLVLRLNLAKQWRTHFYNICLQVGYPHVQADAWTQSLHELENRANRAEEVVRRIRRRKMGLSPQYDSVTFVNPNPAFDFNKADQTRSDPRITELGTTNASIVSNEQKRQSISQISIVSNQQNTRKISSSEEEGSNINYYDDRMNPSNSGGIQGRPRTLSTDISLSSLGYNKGGRNRSFSEDFDALLDVLEGETNEVENLLKPKVAATDKKQNAASNFGASMLQSVTEYLQSYNLPFQHVDLWVPSFSSGESNGNSKSVDVGQLRLHHAGFNFRQDINSELVRNFQEFGVYSSYFSFEPGKGLPGRVYASGVASWECEVHEKDPNDFFRAEGAELYCVKTAFAIPLNTAMVGRIVMILYSCEDVPEDQSLARDITTEVVKYSLEPKWKLVFDSKQSHGIEKNAERSQQKLLPIEEHSAKQFSSFGNEFNPDTRDRTLESNKYTKFPDTACGSNTSFAIPKIELSSQPLMHMVQRDSIVSRISPEDEIQTTHYMHKPSSKVEDSVEDRELASFLNQNMPIVNDSLSGDQVPSSSDAKTLRPYFLSFRLLLLRPSHERTSTENEIIGILKKSFQSYSRDNRRDSKDLATLLVKDWVCLKSTYSLREAVTQRKDHSKADGSIVPVTPLSQAFNDSSAMESFKPIPPPPQDEISLSSIHSGESLPKRVVSDSMENTSDLLSRVSEISSSSTSKIAIDHKRYLPRKSSVDSVQYTSSSV